MTVQAQSADGTIHEFPDGTPDAVIDKVMGEYAASNKPQPHSMTLGEVASGAAQNAIPSAINLGKNIYTAVRHPVDTGTALVNAGRGAGQELGHLLRGDSATAEPTDQTQAFDALKGYFKDRYGSVEGIKKAIATDPVGVAADASAVLGGTSAAVRATGRAGKIADFANQAGHIANPISVALNTTRGISNLAGRGLAEAFGVTTGAGGQSIRTAFNAGVDGGNAADALAANMRGRVPIDQVVADARVGIKNLEAQRGAEYRAGMRSVNSDPTVLSLQPIDDAVRKAGDINNFRGVDLAPSTADVRGKISNLIETWRGQNPAEFHTAEGLDALKKAIGNVRDTTDYGSPDRAVADAAYNAVRTSVANQAPEYAATMRNYAETSDRLKELTKTFSLGENTMRDTAIRKLQSSLRDNVNTSFGRRTDLANELQAAGAPNLMESLAGQTLSSTSPRGLGKLLASGEAGGLVTTAALGHPGAAAAMIPMLAMQSPRLVGETALAAGKGVRMGRALLPSRKGTANAALIAELLGAQDNNTNPQGAASLSQLLMGAAR